MKKSLKDWYLGYREAGHSHEKAIEFMWNEFRFSDLDQLDDWFAEFETSEFERLKEYGIVTKEEADKVEFLFDPDTTLLDDEIDD